jgi:hypothetical protein
VHHILIITEKYIIFVFTKLSKLKYCKQQKEQKAITIIIGCTASKPNISRMHVHQRRYLDTSHREKTRSILGEGVDSWQGVFHGP